MRPREWLSNFCIELRMSIFGPSTGPVALNTHVSAESAEKARITYNTH